MNPCHFSTHAEGHEWELGVGGEREKQKVADKVGSHGSRAPVGDWVQMSLEKQVIARIQRPFSKPQEHPRTPSLPTGIQ